MSRLQSDYYQLTKFLKSNKQEAILRWCRSYTWYGRFHFSKDQYPFNSFLIIR